MTHQLNGRGFSGSTETVFKAPFSGGFDRREQAVSTVMARRYARRARRENRAL